MQKCSIMKHKIESVKNWRCDQNRCVYWCGELISHKVERNGIVLWCQGHLIFLNGAIFMFSVHDHNFCTVYLYVLCAHISRRTLSLANCKIDARLQFKWFNYIIIIHITPARIGNIASHRIASWLKVHRIYTSCVNIYIGIESVRHFCMFDSTESTHKFSLLPQFFFQSNVAHLALSIELVIL